MDNTKNTDCDLVGGSYPGDGLTCDGDPDGDGFAGCVDECPLDPDKVEPGICGCGVPDIDTDGDSFEDCVDFCPDTPEGDPVNGCGCSAFGACRFIVGVCWNGLDAEDCVSIDGVYQGDGSTCDEGCIFGDLDDNGVVDLRDFGAFQRCFTGSGLGLVDPECQRGDIDRCGAINVTDFWGFFNALTGP